MRLPPRLVLYGIIFLNSISLSVVFPSLYNFASRLGISPGLAAFYFASYGVAQFLAGPVLGRLSDNRGRRGVLLLSTLGTAIASFVQAFVGVPSILILARLADGITGGNNTVAEAAIADITTPEERLGAYAQSGAAFGAGFVAGPLLNWWLVGYGLQTPFLAAGILATLATLAVYFALPETLPRSRQKHVALFGQLTRVFTNLVEGVRTPKLGLLFVYMFVYAIAAGAFYFSIQPYVLDVLGRSQGLINGISTLFGAANLLVFPLLPVLQRRFEVITILLALSVFRIVVFAGIPSGYIVFVACASTICIINAFTRPILTAMVTRLSPDSAQGLNIGTLGSAFGAGFALGPILAGLLIDTTGFVSLPFYMSAALTLVVTIFLFVQAPKLRRTV